MTYALNQTAKQTKNNSQAWRQAFNQLWPLLAQERRPMLLTLLTVLSNAGLNLLAPYLMGLAVERYVQTSQYSGVLMSGAVLLVIYLLALYAAYKQMTLMGGVGQRVLYRLREVIFDKLQALPLAFFIQNKAGDLIARINSDTDKLHQFLAETLVRFVGNLFIMFGAGILMLVLDWRLGLVSLAPAILLWVMTRLLSPWVRARNADQLRLSGALSGDIQDNLEQFKVIVAFNRRDYFRERFMSANQANYTAALRAGMANNIFAPAYQLIFHLAQLGAVVFGLILVGRSELSLGLLIAYLTYVTRFYDPLRQMAVMWASFQQALAAWERIAAILGLESDLPEPAQQTHIPAVLPEHEPLMRFDAVCFSYPDGPKVLREASFKLERGKTYAFVGPTGGGKSTTASLMARLYDPGSGKVLFYGQDLRDWPAAERSRRIGFILQEPFLFNTTLAENLVVSRPDLQALDLPELQTKLEAQGLGPLLQRFDQGLATPLGNEGLSLGQKQLVAFIRALLREPELLILDEATANIDTVTEQLLEQVLDRLPAETTRVIIAHRLNTIAAADQIFFVNDGEIVPAGSLEHAVELLKKQQRSS